MRDIWDMRNHDCEERLRDSFDRNPPPYRFYESAEVAEQGWIQGKDRTALVLDPGGMSGQRGEQQRALHCALISG